MYSVLNVTDDITHCGNLGHVVNEVELACKLASSYGFDGINLDIARLIQKRFTVTDVKQLLGEYQLRPAAFSLDVDMYCRHSEQDYLKSLHTFAEQAAFAHQVGSDAALFYIPPFSDNLSFNDYFQLMVKRLKQLKPILIEHKIKIGFEFIGPVETRLTTHYDFIHTIDGVRALIASADLYGYAGFKLDVHHWQYSGAGLLDLKHLDTEYIVYVELNDALNGYHLFNMPEFTRELPLVTGVTDISGFIQSLKSKGYEGPVTVEPWNDVIKKMPLQEAIQTVKHSLDQCIAL
ncbi:sugar phosphate isomerase/epimerase [Endozoicomonas sp. SM1973]|uniref:Sugar phosphate isomerase/epimerase n=1 Tax=Spartinivicinus marinus TaxID=2994442 RepID=A0A853I8V9_9GAMM|nr:sugar phosphate isomerase/epimerase family protein [Spartinivicinus marinus]MCX4028062.1 sugar phosphate isomerase/epimerase [Spartinivicinus marinus]NYZ69289.1 sugar phosphate isomerase/epimerase [Spartinivicinus marinus]